MSIGPIAIAPLTLAITQALKTIFGIDGKTNRIVALVVATLLTFSAIITQQSLVSPEVAMWIEVVVSSVAGGLSAIGLFDYVKELRHQ